MQTISYHSATREPTPEIFICANVLNVPTRCAGCGDTFEPGSFAVVIGNPTDKKMLCDACADNLVFQGFAQCLAIFNDLVVLSERSRPETAEKLLAKIRAVLDETAGIRPGVWP